MMQNVRIARVKFRNCFALGNAFNTSPIMSHLPRKIIVPVRKDTGRANFGKLSTLTSQCNTPKRLKLGGTSHNTMVVDRLTILHLREHNHLFLSTSHKLSPPRIDNIFPHLRKVWRIRSESTLLCPFRTTVPFPKTDPSLMKVSSITGKCATVSFPPSLLQKLPIRQRKKNFPTLQFVQRGE